MDKCILCANELTVEKRRGDYGYFFDEVPHLECNINIIVTQDATYVEVCDNKGYKSTGHIDRPSLPDGEFKKFLENASTFTNKLEESIGEVLE
jgi:hypothetical protein